MARTDGAHDSLITPARHGRLHRRVVAILIGSLAVLATVTAALVLPTTAAERGDTATAPTADACISPVLDFREPVLDERGRPVMDATGLPVWQPAIASGADGTPRHLTSAYILRTATVVEDGAGLPAVELRFDDEGSVLMEAITGRTIGRPLGIFVDGEFVSAPIVQAVIATGAVVTGLSLAEAEVLVARLNAEGEVCGR